MAYIKILFFPQLKAFTICGHPKSKVPKEILEVIFSVGLDNDFGGKVKVHFTNLNQSEALKKFFDGIENSEISEFYEKDGIYVVKDKRTYHFNSKQ